MLQPSPIRFSHRHVLRFQGQHFLQQFQYSEKTSNEMQYYNHFYDLKCIFHNERRDSKTRKMVEKCKNKFCVPSSPFVFQLQLPRSTLPTFLFGIQRSCQSVIFKSGFVFICVIYMSFFAVNSEQSMVVLKIFLLLLCNQYILMYLSTSSLIHALRSKFQQLPSRNPESENWKDLSDGPR